MARSVIYTVTLNPALDKTLVATGLEPEVINRARVARLDWGGKGINVSRALRELGLGSVAMGFLGGATGELLRRGLAQMDIPTDFTLVSEETRVNLTIHDQSRNVLVKLNEAGPVVGDGEIQALLNQVRARLQPGDLWVLSGNLPPGAPDDLYATLISLIAAGGGRTFLDTHGLSLKLGCQARPFLVKPNREEAEFALDAPLAGPEDLRRALGSFLRAGIALPVISLGGEGAVAADGHQALWATPPSVAILSDIGAGDALLAGFVYGLAQGWRLDETLRWAVAAGTAAALAEGTGLCTLARTTALFPQMTLRLL